MSIIRAITTKAYNYLYKDEILLFVGARQAGKTTILKQLQDYLTNKKELTYFLNLEDPEYLELLNQSPKNLFKIFSLNREKRNFVFIDEIQYLKNPSNFLKYIYDQHKEQIKLIVSGSSAFYIDEKFKDSLVGRKKIFNVYTLSFREFLRFKNEPQLSEKDFSKLALTEEEKIADYYSEYITYGGYPKVALAALNEKEELLKEITYSYIKKDIYESGVRSENVFYKLLKILAAQTGSLVNSNELSNTLGASKAAINKYLHIAQKSFHGVLIRPFSQNVRKELTKMPKFYFLDTGLRNFLEGGFTPFALRKDKGPLLENAAMRQLLESYDLNEIKFWRTTQGQEIDFIIKDSLAVEIKFNSRKFRVQDYKKFTQSYPNIPLQVATIEYDYKGRSDFARFIPVWRL